MIAKGGRDFPAAFVFKCIKKSRPADSPRGPNGWDIGKLPGSS